MVAATRVNIDALEARDPRGNALVRLAELGRLLTGQADSTDEAGDADGEARSALVALLEDWRARLGVPGLSAYDVTELDIPTIVADSRGSSMRTNPIVLTDEEIARILRQSL